MYNKYKPDCSILCMIQPDPLPGSYRYNGQSFEEILRRAMRETDMVVENGFDGIILQNMNDMPVKQHAKPEVIAYMTMIGQAIRSKYPKLIIGVLVNWDGVASLAVADAIQADFVRVEHLYTGAEVTSAGILEAQCIEICEMRKRLSSKIPIYADIYEIHGTPLVYKPIEDAAWEAVHEAFADGLFIAGKSAAESKELIKKIRKKLPSTPIFLGGGATGDNIYDLLLDYDGVSVATWIKNGDMKNDIDPQRAQQFIQQALKAKADK